MRLAVLNLGDSCQGFHYPISGFSASTFRETPNSRLRPASAVSQWRLPDSVFDRKVDRVPGLQATILVWVSSYTAVCEVLSKHTCRNFSAISIMTPEQVYLIRQSFDAIWPVRRKLRRHRQSPAQPAVRYGFAEVVVLVLARHPVRVAARTG